MVEWTVEFQDKAVVNRLWWSLEADLAPAAEPGAMKVIKYFVARVKGLKVEIFANEHPPPHFRVSANGETANYRIDDGSQINGGLHRHRTSIQRWHEEHKPILIEAWNKMRPTDCPVGPYRAA